MHNLHAFHVSDFPQEYHSETWNDDPDHELRNSLINRPFVDTKEMYRDSFLELPDTHSPTRKLASCTTKKNRDRMSPLAECDNWLSFDEVETPRMDFNNSNQCSNDQWGSDRSLDGHFTFHHNNNFHQSASSQNDNNLFFSDVLQGNVNDDENETSSLLSYDSHIDKNVPAIRRKLSGFTPLKFLTLRSGKTSTDSALLPLKKASSFKKSASEDDVELLGDWRENKSSGCLAFDTDIYEVDDYILEETEPSSFYNFQDDETVTQLRPTSIYSIFHDPQYVLQAEERDDEEMHGRFLYDDCNQRIPHPGHVNNDLSYGSELCPSFLESFACQLDFFDQYYPFDNIEHGTRQRQFSARRRRKKISKKKKKKRLREQREGSYRASNFQCNLSTIVEHSDEDDNDGDDRESIHSLPATSSGLKQSLSLQSSGSDNASVHSYEDTPYSDGLYNPREIFLFAAQRGDWELQEMQEI